ncbi:expressed unknown protein [Ectocarpus siliculosus]|uniref:Uncharacterized protein n=1 Tax=Ectocarpus siliculosus TaxID=2880 RepID=D8LCJ3_ECTSI|nr:expressed unknown protein [Ectocarpus siliculosus]|eukprot:CBN79506.1 expressed unknown protein [Ectocarpus siliculosus]
MGADSTPVCHRRDHLAATVTRQRRQLPSEWRRLGTPAASSSSSSPAVAAAVAARPRSRRPTCRTAKAARELPEERGRCATDDALQKVAAGGGTKIGPRLRGVQQHRCRTETSSGDQGGWGLIPGANAELRPEADLTSNCFDFPANNFDRENSIKAVNGGNTPYLPLTVGEDAVDFTLHDLEGRRWNLGETLERTGLPVVMVWGMFICPGFQGYGTYPPWDKCGYRDEYDLVEAYGGKATFVHLYGPEPHPAMPGTNFDIGTTWQAFWSVYPQATSYDERAAMAQRINRLIHPSQDILVDYLPGNPYSELIQPVWCSYSMGARPVTVVSPDGKLFFQRAWFHSEHVGRAIDEYWCQQEQQQEQEEGEALRRRSGDSPLQEREGLRQEEGGGLGGFRGTASGGEGPPPGEREAGASDAAGDMGEPGIPPLAGVLARRGEEGPSSSTPPW